MDYIKSFDVHKWHSMGKYVTDQKLLKNAVMKSTIVIFCRYYVFNVYVKVFRELPK